MKPRVYEKGWATGGDVQRMLDEGELLAVVLRDPNGDLGLVLLVPPDVTMAEELAAAVLAYGERCALEEQVTKN